MPLFAGMQNTDTGLAPTINCRVCPVTDGTDGTEPVMWPAPSTQRSAAGPGSILGLLDQVCMGWAAFQDRPIPRGSNPASTSPFAFV